MKISELIEYLENTRQEHGDIDVLCVTPGCASSWETAAPNKDACRVFDTEDYRKEYSGIETEKYLFIGIDG